MTLPTPGDVHVNTPLSRISIGFMQSADAFVADRVFPNIPVMKQSDIYFKYDRSYFNRDDMKKRAPATESSGSGYGVSRDTYYCDKWDHHHDVPDERRANSDDPLNPDREATLLCSQKAMIRREKAWVTNYFAGSIWTGGDVDGVAGVPGASEVKQWNDAASTPIEDVEDGKSAVLEGSGFEPNVLVVGYPVWRQMKHHPDIVDRVKYGQTAPGPARVTLEAVAALLELDRIMVMKAVENTAAEGATEASAFIGGKKALLAYAAPSPGLMIPSAGYTFSWTGLLGASAMGGRIVRFRMQQLNADRVEIGMSFDQKVVATELGYFFDTIVA